MFSSMFSLLSCMTLLLSVAFAAPEPPKGVPAVSDIVAHATVGTGGKCCKALSFVLGAKVVYPLSPGYLATLASYWSLQESGVQPNCIVEALTPQDVQAAIFTLSVVSKKQSFSDECKFAIKGGGHTPQKNAANQPGGVTIDLGGMKAVSVNAAKTVTSISPGNRWGEVYSQLDAMQLAISGGRVSEVGVAGLITGGGISFFSARYGFVCDNVVNFELVLPYGKLVNVNASSNPDLFQSLKGGSNNFGVVTRFDMKTFQQGPFWGGQTIYNGSTAPQQAKAFANVANAKTYDPYAALIHNYVYTGGQWLIVNEYEYTKSPAQPYPPFFKEFTDIKPQIANTQRVSLLTDFTTEFTIEEPDGQRRLFITMSFGVTAALVTKIFDIAKQNLPPIENVNGLLYTVSFQPVPTVITTKATASNPNSLGLDGSDGNIANALMGLAWRLDTDDAAVYAAANKWLAESIQAAKDAGLFNEYVYFNYAFTGQDPIAGYGAAQQNRLRSVSKKYDPDQIFQKAVPGAFKL